MIRRKRMSKKELRAPDEFQSFIMELTEKYGNYWKIAAGILVLIIVIPVIVTGYNYFKQKKENEAAMQYSILLNKIHSLDSVKKVDEINNYINKYGKDDKVLLLEGKVLFESNKFKEAKDIFDEIINSSDREEFQKQAELNKALCLEKLGNKKEAINIFSKLKNNPIVGADATFYLALIYEQLKDNLKAKSFYQEIVDKYKNYFYFNFAKLKVEIL